MRLDLGNPLLLTTLKGKCMFLYFDEIELINQLVYYILLHSHNVLHALSV